METRASSVEIDEHKRYPQKQLRLSILNVTITATTRLAYYNIHRGQLLL